MNAVTDPDAVRQRLLQRAAESAREARAMTTVRSHRVSPLAIGPDASARRLYTSPRAAAILRPGEPRGVWLVELAPGANGQWPDLAAGVQREVLVLRGALTWHCETDAPAVLARYDYLVQRRSRSARALLASHRLHAGPEGAWLYVRESPADPQAESGQLVAHDAPEAWQDYAPSIRRRVLWQHGPLAALLYQAAPGAQVPTHRHGHDEECLMLQGDVFLDDTLLCEGDWQLAPAGTGHRGVSTDIGGVLFAHGDADLAVVASLDG